jgi:hypothetical protein
VRLEFMATSAAQEAELEALLGAASDLRVSNAAGGEYFSSVHNL